MAKSKKMQPTSNTRRRVNPRKLSSQCTKACRNVHHKKKHITASEKKEWDNAICSVCMEYPHNAVLLLCSSYDKGCRPYMCATSNRYSNCLKQYKKAYTKFSSTQTSHSWQSLPSDVDFPEEPKYLAGKSETSELICPLCRGQVKGWTVVERARSYLNAKKRTCMQDNCSFTGTYRELKKHVKLEHPLSRPREVDPTRAEKWKKLESERELNDVYSTIRSTMPGAIVIGDYVIERNHRDDLFDDSFLIPRFGGMRWDEPVFSPDDSFDDGYDSIEEEFARHRARRIARHRGRLFATMRAGRLRIRR